MLDTCQLPLTGETLQRFRQGLMAVAAAEYEQAIFHFERVLQVRPEFYEAWYEKGLALEGCGDYAEAIASFDQAISKRPKADAACQIWYARGNALQYGLGDYMEAITSYDRVLQIKPDHELGWQNRGNALLYGLNAPEEALACYNRTLQINHENDLAWRNRGNALVELRRFSEAIASYDQALTINPSDEISLQARNLVSEQSGLNDRQPTTNPAWYGVDHGDRTFVEGETHSQITFSAKFSAFDQVPPIPQGQPFLVIEDDWGKREVILEKDSYRIGRDLKSDICLHSQFASRHHAILTKLQQPDGTWVYQIKDGDSNGKPSTNGLLINGQKTLNRELKPEDAIVFGPHVRATFRLASTQFSLQ
ncbi:tetratricopeptide repeat protein [Kovacikia minuta CCNUW1]|uniref:tetratricopeptide repeat protein n=1 Tax=Kovacikia minuta TaxID=2931930 RepID=UPI001CCB5C72|nr:tetratricopeptide repeat protein [Kovacikia minuta]UBF26126.1 tetratricopeptide repeat protein [Kovacikia minuta CCNUW1]